MRVIYLSDEPYNLRKKNQLGEATQAEIWTSYGPPGFNTATVTNPSTGLSQNAGSDADSVHISGPENDDVCTMYSVWSTICLVS